MSADAAELLLARAGANMQQLSQEVDKLCLHAGSGGTIDVETAALLTAATVEEDVFALVDAIAELRIDQAIRLYRELLVRREEPIKIAALIARQLKNHAANQRAGAASIFTSANGWSIRLASVCSQACSGEEPKVSSG